MLVAQADTSWAAQFVAHLQTLGSWITWPTVPFLWDSTTLLLYALTVVTVMAILLLVHHFEKHRMWAYMPRMWHRMLLAIRLRRKRAQQMGKRARVLEVHRRLQDAITDVLFKAEEDKLIDRDDHNRLARTLANVLQWQDFLPRKTMLLKKELQLKHVMKPMLMAKHGHKLKPKQEAEPQQLGVLAQALAAAKVK